MVEVRSSIALAVVVVLAGTASCGGSTTSDGPSPGENSAGAKTGGTTTGQSGGPSAGGPNGGTTPGQGGGVSDGRGGVSGLGGASGGGGGSGWGGSGGRAAEACAAPLLPESPLRRLTQIEFDNTVREVFDADELPIALLPSEPRDAPGIGPIRAQHIELYHQFAHDFALQATSSPAALDETTECDLVSEGESACKERLFG